jgi:alpha-L-fucosidase
MTPRKLLALTALAAASVAQVAVAAERSTPPPSTETSAERDARLGWWREARFGMFIHWGLYSGLEGDHNGKSVSNGGVEWYQTLVGLDTDTYATMAKPKFKPSPDCAKAWAKLAKDAGCKYVVLTTKHHEGFDLFDTKLTDFNAKAVTGRDLVREYADATRAEGLHVGFYHSIIDWHHPEYDFRKAKGLPYPKNAAKLAGNKPRDHTKYISFLHDQVVNELMSNYGKIDVLWFDYSSMQFDGDEAWGATALLRDLRAKQPGIIVNNRLFRRPEGGFGGMGTHNVTAKMDPRYGDFVTPEQHIPDTGMPGTDWETCMTLNGTWGYSKYDTGWKSTKDLIQKLGDIVSKGGNFLLNIGPKGDGSIPPETVERMEGIGRWMKVNGDAIYGTTATPFAEKFPWGRVTRKGDTLFLLVFERPKDGVIALPLANGAGATAKLLADGAALKTESSEKSLRITLPEKLSDADATVVRVKLTGAPSVAH